MLSSGDVDMEQLALQVLLGIGVIIGCSLAVTPLCARLRQPGVVGQIVVGLAFGLLPADVRKVIFPADALPSLNVVAQVGLVLFLFTVGYEFDLRLLRRHARTALVTAGGAFVVPMVLGGGLAFLLSGSRLGGIAAITHRVPFALFVAVAMSITAVPVLAWILRDRELQATPIGMVALASASVMDIAGWLVLAVAVALLTATPHSLVLIAVLLPAYVAVMIWVVGPALRRWMRPSYPVTTRGLLLTTLTMVSAWCTGQLGLHVFFGALLMGILTPRRQDGSSDPQLMQWMHRAGGALLPVFFAVTGLSVNIGGLRGTDWAIFGAVCLVAVAGKVGGGTLSTKLHRLPTRFSLAIGVLLNTRGLTELIALTAGYQIGLLSQTLYTILVLMAVTTTAMTGPLLAVLGITRPPLNVVGRDAAATEAATPEAA